MRVYRENSSEHSRRESSLTTREGASSGLAVYIVSSAFPHYTWGCIERTLICGIRMRVPSLHVRVYRVFAPFPRPPKCSLTTREGVSSALAKLYGHDLFPHYAWGCIGLNDYRARRRRVPSLCVRVYRTIEFTNTQVISSLTMREGVSQGHQTRTRSGTFPHYAWGCIVRAWTIADSVYVPSLCVRVYRAVPGLFLQTVCSLTMREGVSEGYRW